MEVVARLVHGAHIRAEPEIAVTPQLSDCHRRPEDSLQQRIERRHLEQRAVDLRRPRWDALGSSPV